MVSILGINTSSANLRKKIDIAKDNHKNRFKNYKLD